MDPAPRLLPVLLVGRWVWPHPYQNAGEWGSLLAGAPPHPDLECSPGPGHPLVPILSSGGAAAAPIPHLTALLPLPAVTWPLSPLDQEPGKHHSDFIHQGHSLAQHRVWHRVGAG